MTETTLTVKQIIDLHLWDKVCDYKGWNPYIINEGRIDMDDLVTFDSEFKEVPEYKDASLYQEEIEEIIKQLARIGRNLHPISEGRIDEAIRQLEYLT